MVMANSCQTRMHGPTPNGGHYSILHWKDRQGRPTSQQQAIQVEVIEYSQEGTEIHRSQAFLDTYSWNELTGK